ncbi:MAG: hypothetical protein U0694_24435 [Anaerolineae bacterium]
MTWSSDNLSIVNTAADQFVQLIIDRLNDERGVHLETAISVAGGVSGVSILRSAIAQDRIDLSKLIKEQPGSYVLIEKVNEIGAEISGFMMNFCKAWGVDPQTGWNMTIPEKHKSLRELTGLVVDFEPPFKQLMAQQFIKLELYPFVAALAAVKLIIMGAETLNPDIGKAIALMAIVAASKTVPYN